MQELLDVSAPKISRLKPASWLRLWLSHGTNLHELPNFSPFRYVEISEDIEVVVSRDRLERVFVNLISNAIDAMAEGGSVQITGDLKSDSVMVLVEDTGSGISEEAWPNLFRPFASFGKKNGLGLGLALSRQSVLDSGGDLWGRKEDDSWSAIRDAAAHKV